RRPIDYGPTRLDELKRGLQTFYKCFERFEEVTGTRFDQLDAPSRRGVFDRGSSAFSSEVGEHRERFLAAMDDDFNTGGALGELFELVHSLNRVGHSLSSQDSAAVDDYRKGMVVLKELTRLLGLFRTLPQKTEEGTSGLA